MNFVPLKNGPCYENVPTASTVAYGLASERMWQVQSLGLTMSHTTPSCIMSLSGLILGITFSL